MYFEYLIISLYVLFGLIWFRLSGTSMMSIRLFGKLAFGLLFILLWPLMLLLRIERANRIGKYLKPHSKWQLIVKNKVILSEKEDQQIK